MGSVAEEIGGHRRSHWRQQQQLSSKAEERPGSGRGRYRDKGLSVYVLVYVRRSTLGTISRLSQQSQPRPLIVRLALLSSTRDTYATYKPSLLSPSVITIIATSVLQQSRLTALPDPSRRRSHSCSRSSLFQPTPAPAARLLVWWSPETLVRARAPKAKRL